MITSKKGTTLESLPFPKLMVHKTMGHVIGVSEARKGLRDAVGLTGCLLGTYARYSPSDLEQYTDYLGSVTLRNGVSNG